MNMNEITLLYARNLITRRTTPPRQMLSFVMRVANLAYDKEVDVSWAGEDEVWHKLPASFHATADDGASEYWVAQASFTLDEDATLPGNVRFALCHRSRNAEYWDNNQGSNYAMDADCGILLGNQRPLISSALDAVLATGQKEIALTVTLRNSLPARRVTLHWTTDNWQTARKTPYRFRRNYWDNEWLSNARNPNQYGYQVWHTTLKAADAFRIQYRIACETAQQVIWDDNAGADYTLQRPPLKVLILNLHCCQEENQDRKLSLIARAIDELAVDIVCLQEVAELWNDGRGDWQSNTARIINERLAAPFQLVTDWSHKGFERYREGVAILSRHPIARHQARFVSTAQDPHSIHTRKVVMAQIKVPHLGLLNVFSSHLSWWNDGFAEQFDNLRRWATDEHTAHVAASLLCGDFNIEAGSRGYRFVVDSHEYDDQYLRAVSPQVFRSVFRPDGAPSYDGLRDDRRIDYVFLRRGSALRAVSGRVVFNDHDYGRVSDHCGYLLSFAAP